MKTVIMSQNKSVKIPPEGTHVKVVSCGKEWSGEIWRGPIELNGEINFHIIPDDPRLTKAIRFIYNEKCEIFPISTNNTTENSREGLNLRGDQEKLC